MSPQDERAVFVCFCFFFNTSFRDNRTPGTTQRYERYVKESPRTAGTWDRLRGTGWRPLPPKGGACEISCWDRMHKVPHMIGTGM